MSRPLSITSLGSTLVSNQHKKPILAFVVLAVIAAALVGNQVHARADGSRFVASGPIAAHTQVQDGVLALPGAGDRDNPADRSEDRSAAPADPRTDKPRGPSLATVLTEPVDVTVERPFRKAGARGDSTRSNRMKSDRPRPGHAGQPGVGAAGEPRPDRHPGKHAGHLVGKHVAPGWSGAEPPGHRSDRPGHGERLGRALGHSPGHAPGHARGHGHPRSNPAPAGHPVR